MAEFILQTIFWASVVVLFYIYLGYPLLVYLLSVLFPQKPKKEEIFPEVTVLITAYNEEKDIRQKLENTLQIDYPTEKLEIMVASDGSTDKTDKIVKDFAERGVKLFRQEGRVGKTITQNNALREAKGEIILFSDATTMYQADVLRKILPNFADEKIGCVAGKLVYVDASGSNVGKGAKSYWNYETILKESESRFCSLIGASGCLYALRKSVYVEMPAEACSDFIIVSLIYEKGLRTVFEPQAVCTEVTNQKTKQEMKMRVRVIGQTLTDLWRHRNLFNPLKFGFYSIELLSHKVLRYSVPLFLLICLVLSGVLAFRSWFFVLAFLTQSGFYLTAFLAWLFEKSGRKAGLFSIPLYFVLANLASVIAFYRFMRGEKYARWEPIRESSKENVQTT